MSTEPRTFLRSARRPRPGRPRKQPENGHSAGTARANGYDEPGPNGRPQALQALGPLLPRVLGKKAASEYLGVSERTIDYLEEAGRLKRVCVPSPDGDDLRRALYDRQDLDILVEQWKA